MFTSQKENHNLIYIMGVLICEKGDMKDKDKWEWATNKMLKLISRNTFTTANSKQNKI